MTDVERALGRVSSPTGSEDHRLDIEGLRAIAVGVVILFHAKVPFMLGGYVGVDVFFVLSGFLITGLLVREMERDHSVDLLRFYARRIRRLLPASALALVGTAIVAFLALPVTRWRGTGLDVVWSSLYAVNWRFAGQAVDYLAADIAPSPVLHFWSLAVEEQFYLVWPFLLLVSTFLARRRLGDVRRPLVMGLLAVAVPSFAWSVYFTQTNPASAYFVTTTRMWELAVGGGLAILAPRMARMSRTLAGALSVAGVVGIVLGAVIYDSATLFPGYTALLPVMSTAVIVAAGTAHRDVIGARSLSWGPLVVIGGMSYSLYLWHWIFLVGADAAWGPLSVPINLVVVSVSVIPAWISHRFVEQPIRRSRAFITPPMRGLVFGLALTLIGVGAGVWLWSSVPTVAAAGRPSSEVTLASPPTGPDAPADEPITVINDAETIVPDPIVARDDVPAVYADGCHQPVESSEPVACSYGVADAPIVALVGDSHAAQWVPTLRLIADAEGFELRTYTKSACPFAAVTVAVGNQQRPYDTCVEWNQRVVADLLSTENLRLVVTSGAFWTRPMDTSGRVLSPIDAVSRLTEGLVVRWSELIDAGVDVVVIRDTPYPRFDVPECVVSNRNNLSECAFDRATAMAGNTAQIEAAKRVEVRLVDLTDRICAEDECPAVVDEYLVWRDTHHLTATYARVLAGALNESVGEWIEPDSR